MADYFSSCYVWLRKYVYRIKFLDSTMRHKYVLVTKLTKCKLIIESGPFQKSKDNLCLSYLLCNFLQIKIHYSWDRFISINKFQMSLSMEMLSIIFKTLNKRWTLKPSSKHKQWSSRRTWGITSLCLQGALVYHTSWWRDWCSVAAAQRHWSWLCLRVDLLNCRLYDWYKH